MPGLAPHNVGCLATDRITVEGRPVGYMFRDDWGWTFAAGDESVAYLENSDNMNLHTLNEIANCDRAILPYLNAPPGAAFIRHGDRFFEDPEGAPRSTEHPIPPSLNPEFPVVEGYHELTDNWALSLPEPMNGRIERGAAAAVVFWRPGLTAGIRAWGNPNNDAPAYRMRQVKAHISPEGYDLAEWSANGVDFFTYRLAEAAADNRLPALYGFAVSTPGHLDLSLYFDSGDDLASAKSLIRSIKTVR